MSKEIRERFGVLIRPSGRFEIVQLGVEGGDKTLLEELDTYFDGTVEYVRNAEQLAFVTREGAFDEGLTKNEAASFFAGISVFGDVIVLPKRDGDRQRVRWGRVEAYKQMVLMDCDWRWYVNYANNPDKYAGKKKKA